MRRKLIYRFASGNADGRTQWRNLLGGKGANLAEMANMGIPVPPGFTITTQVCVDYMQLGKLPGELLDEVQRAMSWLEKETGKRFGEPDNPLLVSVRSGARQSMPGMMDTILDLGLNERTVQGLSESASPRFAWDAYRRLLAMFGDVVLGVPHQRFDAPLDAARRAHATQHDMQVPDDPEALGRLVPDSVLQPEQLKRVVTDYKAIIADEAQRPFPEDPSEQLEQAIEAVFKSWDNPRARLYRDMHGFPHTWGTAVNVQAMVFGNLGDTSATGVAFTRDPSTGEKIFFGEWLPNAQGEDVVAGVRTPRPLGRVGDGDGTSLQETLPDGYGELLEIQAKLETHFRDMQDLEFTIENGRLFLLQTRNGKRSAHAAVRIAVEMVSEGLLHEDEALLRIEPQRLQELLFPTIDPKADHAPIASGLPASPGAVSGKAVFDADSAERLGEGGEDVILVRVETSPEDLHGMRVAKGILTARGGATSHAAVVARGMGRPCVAGCGSLGIDYARRRMQAHAADGSVTETIQEGDLITIDGSKGRVYLGRVPTIDTALNKEMQILLGWAAKARRMQVRANADTPEQARKAAEFGADGIGLCRTEHMFFDDERIGVVREMIVAGDGEARRSALDRLLPYQVGDFLELFRALDGRPVNIRLLDPPLHEFLPQEHALRSELAERIGVSLETVERRLTELHEQNPMLGHRGVRLAVTYPEIAEMQVKAILTAACKVQAEGTSVAPEIMIPLILGAAELAELKTLTQRVAEAVFEELGTRVDYQLGTMIELPRAALLADEIAEHADYFSFGTNDLTQTTLGLSRDDAGRFLPVYVQKHLLQDDPFVTLDVEGVGKLVRMASEAGRRIRPQMKLGICGEHGGEPKSIAFCEELGLSYVSCSPFRIPIAQLAAAQAALHQGHSPTH